MLNNSADISYYADIVVGNQTFSVLVDTGRCVELATKIVDQCSDMFPFIVPTFGWQVALSRVASQVKTPA